MLRIILTFIVLTVGSLNSAPADLFTFNNGNVGVDFLGFKASAGLGGLLTGNVADGGLHAEAGTPYGQAARAGLAGNINKGTSVGGLYADATAGGGVEAGAGLAGNVGAAGSFGKTYAGAAAGGVSTVVKEKTIVGKPAVSGSFIAKTVVSKPVAAVEVHKEVIVPEVKKHVKVVHEIKPQKTYIERTVIPNYEEKTIYVPSYVEKTVRVPTVVEKKVRVPVAPTVIEKTVSAPATSVNVDTSINAHVIPTETHVYEKTKIHTRPHFRKHFWYGGYGGYGGGEYGGATGAEGQGDVAGAGTLTVRKTVNTHLIDDIFNIPISTLSAVNKLVGGIAGGTSGSFQVSKTASLSSY